MFSLSLQSSTSSDKYSVLDDPPSQPLKLGDIRLNLRRLSKMVLGGYGGASLIFFGLPYPETELSHSTLSGATKSVLDPDSPLKASTLQQDANILAQVVHDADDEEISAGTSRLAHSRDAGRLGGTPHSRNPTQGHHTRASTSFRPDPYPNSIGRHAGGSIPFPCVSTSNLSSTLLTPPGSPMRSPADPLPASPTHSVPKPSWWEIVTGQRDKEIFEGFAAAAIAAGEIKEAGKEAKKELKRGELSFSLVWHHSFLLIPISVREQSIGYDWSD